MFLSVSVTRLVGGRGFHGVVWSDWLIFPLTLLTLVVTLVVDILTILSYSNGVLSVVDVELSFTVLLLVDVGWAISIVLMGVVGVMNTYCLVLVEVVSCCPFASVVEVFDVFFTFVEVVVVRVAGASAAVGFVLTLVGWSFVELRKVIILGSFVVYTVELVAIVAIVVMVVDVVVLLVVDAVVVVDGGLGADVVEGFVVGVALGVGGV